MNIKINEVAGILADPAVVDRLDRQGVEMVPALAALAARQDQLRLFQHLQVLHDRATVHLRKSFAQRARRQRRVLDRIQHLPPLCIGQRLENGVLFRFA